MGKDFDLGLSEALGGDPQMAGGDPWASGGNPQAAGLAAWRALLLCGAFGALLAAVAVRSPPVLAAGPGAAVLGPSGLRTQRRASPIDAEAWKMGDRGVRELRGLPTIGGRRAVDLAREAWARGGALPLDRWADLPGIGSGSVLAVRAELERRAGAQ